MATETLGLAPLARARDALVTGDAEEPELLLLSPDGVAERLHVVALVFAGA